MNFSRQAVMTELRCFTLASVFLSVLLSIGQVLADPVDTGIAELRSEWLKGYYHEPENRKEQVFKTLVDKAHQFALSHPARAEPMVWEAIIRCSYAKFSGGLTALSKVNAAREELERAEKITPKTLSTVLETSLYTTLAGLYYQVPGWPISFGDKKKAQEYLDKAIRINPDGIDPNYSYGDFLLQQGRFNEAKPYFEKVLKVPHFDGEDESDQEQRDKAKKALERIRGRG